MDNCIDFDRLVIWGCGGHARSILNIILSKYSKDRIILIDKNAKDNEVILGCKAYREYSFRMGDYFIVAIGNNFKRKKIYSNIVEKYNDIKPFHIISDSASIGLNSEIGDGSLIGNMAYIGPEAKIGTNTIINTSSIVEHEVIIGDNSHIAPNVTICGRSRVGNQVFCGAGSTVIDGITICDNVIIGAGATVVKNIDKPGVYVGCPAKRLDERDVDRNE